MALPRQRAPSLSRHFNPAFSPSPSIPHGGHHPELDSLVYNTFGVTGTAALPANADAELTPLHNMQCSLETQQKLIFDLLKPLESMLSVPPAKKEEEERKKKKNE